MSKCKHDTWDDLDGASTRRCVDCNVRLPIGPARIAPEDREQIVIEIRAAELADLFLSHANSMESSGWGAHRYSSDHVIDNAEWHAGWLAHAIWSHDEEASS